MRYDSPHEITPDYQKLYEIAKKDSSYENSLIAAKGTFFVAVGAFFVLCFFFPFSLMNIVSAMYVANVVFDSLIAERFFGVKVKKIADIYCVAFLVFTMPILWFQTGGFTGIGCVWMLFAAIYCIYGIYGTPQRVILLLFGAEVIAVVTVTYLHPELCSDIPEKSKIILSIISLLTVGAYIQTVSGLQKELVTEEREKLVEVQEELTAHFEQSIAMNDELRNLTDKLEMANKTQRSFNASMNHELRAPLNGIEGCLQILLMDDSVPAEAKETVKNAITASKTINQTVNDLLDFAKLEEGKFEIVDKSFDLRDVLDNISTIFKPQAHAKNLSFIIQIPTETRVSLVGDGVRIQQVMTNLISNGIKYTKEGSVTMIVTTQRGHLKFTVKDTGQGMSEDSLKDLFDPFTRFNLDQNVHIQGTGLGMNIVHNMIKAMEGKITVESKLGEGTIFDVDIPIIFYDSDITFNSPREKQISRHENIDFSSYRVLCVDDTEVNRAVCKGLLKNTGAKVTTMDSGARALKLCGQVKFDIIFLDHMMPDMDGIETLDEIRKIDNGEKYKDTPIIMFTGNAGEEYKKLYKEHGANGYLLKPIMYDELIECFELVK